jgi:hypothetical protein
MKINKNVSIDWNNPNEEFALGIFCQSIYMQWIDNEKLNEPLDEENFKEGYRLIIGFLIFSINIIW